MNVLAELTFQHLLEKAGNNSAVREALFESAPSMRSVFRCDAADAGRSTPQANGPGMELTMLAPEPQRAGVEPEGGEDLTILERNLGVAKGEHEDALRSEQAAQKHLDAALAEKQQQKLPSLALDHDIARSRQQVTDAGARTRTTCDNWVHALRGRDEAAIAAVQRQAKRDGKATTPKGKVSSGTPTGEVSTTGSRADATVHLPYLSSLSPAEDARRRMNAGNAGDYQHLGQPGHPPVPAPQGRLDSGISGSPAEAARRRLVAQSPSEYARLGEAQASRPAPAGRVAGAVVGSDSARRRMVEDSTTDYRRLENEKRGSVK